MVPERARFWVEVPDTQKPLEELGKLGVTPVREPLKLPIGLLVEVADLWGNVAGFTDHLAQPQLGGPVKPRKPKPRRLAGKKSKKKK